MSTNKFDPKVHHRKSIRLHGFDYSRAGAYFVTIVTHGRAMLFGEIVDGEMRLNQNSEIVQAEWLELPKRLSYVELGVFVVMPNHFHGIVFLRNVGATRPGLSVASSGNAKLQAKTSEGIDGSPLPSSPTPPRGTKPASLGAIIAQFKSRVTKRLWKTLSLRGVPIWQRNYYEHILRSTDEGARIEHYILSNPAMWMEDEENPLRNV